MDRNNETQERTISTTGEQTGSTFGLSQTPNYILALDAKFARLERKLNVIIDLLENIQ